MNLWTGGPTGGDRVAVLTQFSNTTFAKEVGNAGNIYGANQITSPGSTDIEVTKQGLSAFNVLTARQQQMIVNQSNNAQVNGPFAQGKAVDGVDGYRAMLQADVDRQEAAAAQAQPTPPVKVTLSASAQAHLSQAASPTATVPEGTQDTPEQQALATLKNGAATNQGSVALAVLQTAAERRRSALPADQTKNVPSAARIARSGYAPGERVDTSI